MVETITERYQVDVFGIIVLIVAVLVVVFLVIAAIYMYNLMNLKPPSRGESTFLFWTTVILAVIMVIIAIYALVHIFNHKSTVHEKESKVVTTPVITQPAVVTATLPSQVTLGPPTNQSVTLSSLPVTQTQFKTLDENLLNLGQDISQ